MYMYNLYLYLHLCFERCTLKGPCQTQNLRDYPKERVPRLYEARPVVLLTRGL